MSAVVNVDVCPESGYADDVFFLPAPVGAETFRLNPTSEVYADFNLGLYFFHKRRCFFDVGKPVGAAVRQRPYDDVGFFRLV